MKLDRASQNLVGVFGKATSHGDVGHKQHRIRIIRHSNEITAKQNFRLLILTALKEIGGTRYIRGWRARSSRNRSRSARRPSNGLEQVNGRILARRICGNSFLGA